MANCNKHTDPIQRRNPKQTPYSNPGIAETTDLIWAPISGMLLVAMYKGTTGKVAGVIGTLEELIPFTDIIPTFTITWFYENYLDKKNNK